MRISFILNSKEVMIDCSPDTRLVHILREHFGLLGTKEGCLQGKCGYCTILLNGELVPSCILPVFSVFKESVITIEGFRTTPEFSDIEKGFLQAGVNPCGFCSSTKILTAHKLIKENPSPTDSQIRKAMSDSVCRCTSYSALVEGVKSAALYRRSRSHGK